MTNIDKVLKDLSEFTKGDLDYALRYFFCDVRKQTGDRYPPQTLKDICSGIQFYFNNSLGWTISIFNDKDFATCRKSLDAQMKLSARMGNIKPAKKAVIITEEMEHKLWDSGALGSANPKQLLNSLSIYFFGLHFSMRAAQEHRNLIYGNDSQLTLYHDHNGEEYLKYCERMSKNRRFGLKCFRMEPKVTRMYSREDKTRCPIELYKIYLSHRPESHGKPGCDAFYLTPTNNNPSHVVWYKASPLGLHSIQQATKSLTSCLDLERFVSNTSLRRTAQNRLLKSGSPTEVIHKKTGRISQAADASYTDPSIFEKEMSDSLYGDQCGNVKEKVSSSHTPPIELTNCSNCVINVTYNIMKK